MSFRDVGGTDTGLDDSVSYYLTRSAYSSVNYGYWELRELASTFMCRVPRRVVHLSENEGDL